MSQTHGANWLFSGAFLFSLPVILLQIYVTVFERALYLTNQPATPDRVQAPVAQWA